MPLTLGRPLEPGGAALLVTAHPDDEVMFFLPTIVSLQAQGTAVHILCLSTGNASGLGSVRRQELSHACSLLGISSSSIKLVDDPALPDGLDTCWPLDVIAAHVTAAVASLKATSIITFDAYGVSGHPNHRAVSLGVATALQEQVPLSMPTVSVYNLESTSFWRTFSGPMDLLLSIASVLLRGHSVCYINGGPRLAWQAMQAHWSQFVWYRRLYVLFSRYVYVNTLVCHNSL